jgi:exopolyphosphatase/guanosine-5'-triphosphate,3'-diphosphate pyrophosphatase
MHGLGDAEREYLEAAAILHEVGLFVSHTQHHRHSYYLIRNADILGFTENEKEIVANVARYHRKSHPKEKHEGFRLLTSEDQDVVTRLAAILRIADGLDRNHASMVRRVSVRRSGRSVRMMLTPRGKRSPDLEIWGSERKKQLFEETFGVNVRILAA